jgi:two-component system, NarL family, response regulator DevR
VSSQCLDILLVEDHPLVRLGLRTVIDAQDDMRVVSEAATGEEAVSAARGHVPGLAIVPLRLEGELRGIELCRELKSVVPTLRVLIYTSYNSTEDASAAFLSGADSFVYKGEDSARLLDTIRTTAAGRRSWLLGAETQDQSARLAEAVERSGLTQREREVLGFMLQRLTNAQIANELFIELPTVKTHVRNILGKLGLRSRRDLFAPTGRTAPRE